MQKIYLCGQAAAGRFNRGREQKLMGSPEKGRQGIRFHLFVSFCPGFCRVLLSSSFELELICRPR